MENASTLQLLDLASLGTIGGLTLATTAVTNGLARAFEWQPRWLGLIVSLLVCLATAFFDGTIAGVNLFLAVLNGFVVYLAAAGTSAAGAAIQKGPVGNGHELPGGLEGTRVDRRLLRPWF
jgi:hypothetical protein